LFLHLRGNKKEMRERTKYEPFQKESKALDRQRHQQHCTREREMKKYVCTGGAQKNQRKWQCLSVMYEVRE
jgi:hypothetical protein